MSENIRIADLSEFDITEHLEDDQAIAEHLSIVLEENDTAALAQALGTAARARGMTEIAKASGIAREALDKALRPTHSCGSTRSTASVMRWASNWWLDRSRRESGRSTTG